MDHNIGWDIFVHPLGGLLRGAGAPLTPRIFLILEALISFEKLKEISNFLQNTWREKAKIAFNFQLFWTLLTHCEFAIARTPLSFGFDRNRQIAPKKFKKWENFQNLKLKVVFWRQFWPLLAFAAEGGRENFLKGSPTVIFFPFFGFRGGGNAPPKPLRRAECTIAPPPRSAPGSGSASAGANCKSDWSVEKRKEKLKIKVSTAIF